MPRKITNTLLLTTMTAWTHNWGGTAVTGPVGHGIPGRLGEMHHAARQLTERPLKVSAGAGRRT